MILSSSRLRLTQAKYFGKYYGAGTGTVTSVSEGNGINATPNPIVGVGIIALGPLSSDWDAGNYDINSRNAMDVENVKAFGAVGDAVVFFDGAMPAASVQLTSATTNFVTADIGKIVTVQGAGAAGTTLVSTIASLVGPSPSNVVNLNNANASGAPVANKIGIYGTDDHLAIQAAVTSLGTIRGGIVLVPHGRYMIGNNTLDVSVGNGITLMGVGRQNSGGVTGSQLIFTRAAGTCIDLNGTGNGLVGLTLRPEHFSFSGTVVDASTAGTSMAMIRGNIFDGNGAGSPTFIDVSSVDSIEHVVEDNNFLVGGIGIQGPCGVLAIRNNQFVSYKTVPIKDAGQSWTISGNTFEQGFTNQAAGILCSIAGTIGLRIEGNWFGDCSSAAAGQAWIKIDAAYGVEISSNFIDASLPGSENVTGIVLTSACVGLVIKGNYLNMTGAASVGIDGGGFLNTNVDFTGNRNVSTTAITGFDSSNYFSQGTGSFHRFGIGSTNPDVYAYGGTISVIESRGRSAFGVLQATGNTADTDGNLAAQYDFATMTNSGGDKRIAAINAALSGGTATNRGGKLYVYTKKDAGALTAAVVVDKDQNVGVGTTSPTRLLDLNGTQRTRGIAAPAVSEANSGTVYFDSTLNRYRVSMNGSAYVDLVGSAGLTGSGVAGRLPYWSGATSLSNAANLYVDFTNNRLGLNVAVPAYRLDVDGDINITTGSVLRVNALPVLTTNAATDVTTVGGDNGPALGNFSTAVGRSALNVGTGIDNTAVGHDAAVLTVAGTSNTALGKSAGAANTTGSQNVYLGAEANAAAGNLSNAVAIGYQASVAASNSMSLGNMSMKVGIRTPTPAVPLDVAGAMATRHLDIVLVDGLNSDIALTDSSWIRITGPVNPFSLGGFTGGVDGRHLTVFNTTAQVMTIVNLDAGSAAVNQITTLTGGNVILAARTTSATFLYEDVSDTWILTAYNG